MLSTSSLWALLALCSPFGSLGFMNTPSRVLIMAPRVQTPKKSRAIIDGPHLKKYMPKFADGTDDEALIKRQATADASSDGEKKGFLNKVCLKERALQYDFLVQIRKYKVWDT